MRIAIRDSRDIEKRLGPVYQQLVCGEGRRLTSARGEQKNQHVQIARLLRRAVTAMATLFKGLAAPVPGKI